jgi:hypothetical protein
MADMEKCMSMAQVKDLRQLGDNTRIVIPILDLKSLPN